MATTPKKRSKKPKVTRTASRVESVSQLKKMIATQEKTITTQARELRQAAEQQTATGEVLRIIASSPTELQSVLDTLLANAVKLSGATKGHIRQYDGEFLRYVSHYNESVEVIAALNQLPQRPRPESMSTRALLEKNAIHVLDAQAEPNFRSPAAQAQARTMLFVPLLREGSGIGTITIWRDFVEAFTERQIELVKTFADQAVIAIENVRLFQELKQRTAQLETSNAQLTEALEHQTATSEILGVIASSPTDIQPVLDAVAESAARLCDATDALIHRIDSNICRLVASYGPIPHIGIGEEIAITRTAVPGRAIYERKTVHVHDLAAVVEIEFPDSKIYQQRRGTRTILCTPLLREGVPIGVILIRRLEVRPFSEKQIKLLETFADQAVIAIENVRLFQELQARNRDLMEALEQQTATSEILRVIASSPTDLQPVLDTVAENAARLSGATDTIIFRIEGDTFRLAASYGITPLSATVRERGVPVSRATVSGRAVFDRETIHVHDIAQVLETEFPDSKPYHQHGGFRTCLATPLLREGVPIGVIQFVVRRSGLLPKNRSRFSRPSPTRP
jgi:two-component system NtrC family sensor kinase